MPDKELFARVVACWSHKVLHTHTYGDQRSMRLPNGRYETLRTVADAARAERRLQAAAAASRLIDRQVREGRAARYRTGGPSKGLRG
jgi:hypothetical protein